MKTALIFPGQGSQFIGMGVDFYNKYPVSQEIFSQLNKTLDRDLSKLIFQGDIIELSKTQNSQPAIMATSIAILNALKAENLISENSYQAVAGHSLGEYSALVANGSIKFTDSVRLLKIRSKAMQESMPLGTGGMIALLGCSKELINKVMDESSRQGKIYIANDNADGQIVLSGVKSSIDFILENTKNLGIRKAILLPVSAPFHCELMKYAADVLSVEINDVKFNKFSVPLYSNVTSKLCSENEISNLLIQQIVSTVRWRELVLNMINDGVQRFIEIGPGNVLSNLVKRISKNATVISIEKIEDFEKLTENKL